MKKLALSGLLLALTTQVTPSWSDTFKGLQDSPAAKWTGVACVAGMFSCKLGKFIISKNK